jgi:hypothetical protein
MDSVFRRGKTVVRKLQIAFNLNETRSAQVGKMARHSRLWELENLYYIADTELACGKDTQDSYSRWVGKTFKNFVEVIERRDADRQRCLSGFRVTGLQCHIWHSEYNLARRI